ncbi:MAG: hypothetical protein JSV73_10470 [Flavobacteriaceae bacterium]|nr:MAG: hypothetical protein JSV73_10470 [Flavobacteriaceae bacterium]
MMNSEFAESSRDKLRRVSKARIFDGHPLKLSIHAIFVMVLTYVAITSVITLLFAYFYKTESFLVFWALLPGALLGFVLLILERFLGQLKNYLFPQMGKLLTAFLLFFAHIIGYLTLSSVVVNYPIGYLMATMDEMNGLAGAYSLFSVNFFIVLALVSWQRNVRLGPNSCF